MKRGLRVLMSRKMGMDPDDIVGRRQTPGVDLADYHQDLDRWARKVRRDILVIEYHLQMLGVDPVEMYGDPGDPPPPPE